MLKFNDSNGLLDTSACHLENYQNELAGFSGLLVGYENLKSIDITDKKCARNKLIKQSFCTEIIMKSCAIC
jgi:hypothetical protein